MIASFPSPFNYFPRSWYVQTHFQSILLTGRKKKETTLFLAFSVLPAQKKGKSAKFVLILSLSFFLSRYTCPFSKFNWGKHLVVLFWGFVRQPQSFRCLRTWVFGNINLFNLKISSTSQLAAHSIHLLSASHKDIPSARSRPRNSWWDLC